MKKRLISEYASFVLLICIIALYYKNFIILAILLSILWYLLFGMVGLAYQFSTMKRTKISNFFLKITIPATLLPFRKAGYYWIKAINIVSIDSARVAETYEILKKINPDNLYTDNNKSMYYSMLAALHHDLGDNQTAMKYLEMANQLPHKRTLNDSLEKLREKITE